MQSERATAQKNHIHEQATALFGLKTESIGKTEARQNFLPLVADLQKRPRTIEITDRQAPIAMLITYDHYATLISQLAKLSKKVPKKKIDLMGSVTYIGDLDKAGKEIAEEFEEFP